MPTIVIETLSLPDGGLLIVPSPEQVGIVANELSKDNKLTEAANLVEREKTFRDKHADKITRNEFPYRSYTYGEKMDAKRESTTWSGMTSSLDSEQFMDRLAAIALGWKLDELYKLTPSIAQALRVRIVEAVEPSEARVDYFLSNLPQPSAGSDSSLQGS